MQQEHGAYGGEKNVFYMAWLAGCICFHMFGDDVVIVYRFRNSTSPKGS